MRLWLVVALWVVACSAPSGLAVPPGDHAIEPPTTHVVGSDLATCTLVLRAYELGDRGGTLPSAPVRAGDGFVVAYTRFVDPEYEVVTQRVGSDGVLAAPIGHGFGPGPLWAPNLAGRGDDIVLVTGRGSSSVATHLDVETGAATTASVLAAWPDALAIGPRGLVMAELDGKRLRIQRVGLLDVSVPSTNVQPIPAERLLASGDEVDVVLTRRDVSGDRVVSVLVLAAGVATGTTYELLREHGPREHGEMSIAAVPDGFAIVRAVIGGPLEIHRLDAQGRRVGDARPLAVAEGTVTRYPRLAALGRGLVVTYWDGIGPTLLRVDADGREVGERIPLRSGDERGGHTDAGMAVSETAIAVSWLVDRPTFGHGFPDEDPERPGPRLGVLGCAAR